MSTETDSTEIKKAKACANKCFDMAMDALFESEVTGKAQVAATYRENGYIVEITILSEP